MRKTVSILILLIGLLPYAAQAESDEAPLIFAVNSEVKPLLNQAFVNETIRTIQKAVAPRTVKIEYAELPVLEKMMEDHAADLYLSTSSTLRRFQYSGVRDLVTASSPFSKDPNKSEGSLLIVRKDRADLNDLADLKDKRAAAGRPTAFGMYLAALGEIAKSGYEPKTFFSSTRFYGLDRDQIIRDVLDGKADVGILRVCYFEDAVNRKVVNPNALKFINLQSDPEHACLHSTALYPNWSVGSSSQLGASEVSAITVALISQKPTAVGLHWSMATDFTEIDNLHRALNLGPFERFSRFWYGRLLYDNRYWLTALLSLFVLIALHSFLVARKVRIRTRELQESLKRESEIFQQAKEANRRLSGMQRAGVVSQVSSLIAHELNQPLASIKLYARGLQRADEAGRLDRETMKSTLTQIREDADLASSIVERVRSYAKGTDSGREVTDMGEVIQKAIREIQRQSGSKITIKTHWSGDFFAQVHVLEFELVFINLIRNSIHALESQNVRKPEVRIGMRRQGKRIIVTIEDNASISDEAFDSLTEPVQSAKPQGLGLGMQIVRGIVQNHGGKVSFEKGSKHGLIVTVQIPIKGKQIEQKGS